MGKNVFYYKNIFQIRVYGGDDIERRCTKRKPPPLSDEGAVRGRWHRCRMNVELLISQAPMTEGVSNLHENCLTITVKLSFNSTQNNQVWFSCWYGNPSTAPISISIIVLLSSRRSPSPSHAIQIQSIFFVYFKREKWRRGVWSSLHLPLKPKFDDVLDKNNYLKISLT